MTAWQYVLVGSTDDHDRALDAALDGRASVDLVRTVAGTSAAELARPDGNWHDTDRLQRIKYRGDIAWAVPVTTDEARRVVTAWQRLGRLRAVPDLEQPVPAELLTRVRVTECAARLRAAPPLSAEAVRQVRGVLLDDAGEIAVSWLAGADRVAVPVQAAWRFGYPEDIARARAAFRTVGATTLWAVSIAEADKRARWGVPASVEVPNEDDWLGGVGSVYFATGDVVLTTPALDVAVLQRVEYGVVAGPAAFVRTLLGVEPDDAHRAFGAYLRGESYRTPSTDLRAVAERYGAARPAISTDEGAQP